VHLRNGRLADLAPTVLELLGLPQPVQMTGHSLLNRDTIAPHATAKRATA